MCYFLFPLLYTCIVQPIIATTCLIFPLHVEDTDFSVLLFEYGSGGRDLKGNKRTNKEQSFDQEFKDSNQALLVSCEKGYPVRVVR